MQADVWPLFPGGSCVLGGRGISFRRVLAPQSRSANPEGACGFSPRKGAGDWLGPHRLRKNSNSAPESVRARLQSCRKRRRMSAAFRPCSAPLWLFAVRSGFFRSLSRPGCLRSSSVANKSNTSLNPVASGTLRLPLGASGGRSLPPAGGYRLRAGCEPNSLLRQGTRSHWRRDRNP